MGSTSLILVASGHNVSYSGVRPGVEGLRGFLKAPNLLEVTNGFAAVFQDSFDGLGDGLSIGVYNYLNSLSLTLYRGEGGHVIQEEISGDMCRPGELITAVFNTFEGTITIICGDNTTTLSTPGLSKILAPPNMDLDDMNSLTVLAEIQLVVVVDVVAFIPLPSDMNLNKCLLADYSLEYDCSFSNESIIYEKAIETIYEEFQSSTAYVIFEQVARSELYTMISRDYSSEQELSGKVQYEDLMETELGRMKIEALKEGILYPIRSQARAENAFNIETNISYVYKCKRRVRT
eukprot:sb/3467598/